MNRTHIPAGQYARPDAPSLDKPERRKRRPIPGCVQNGLMMIQQMLFGMERPARHARAGALFLFAVFIGPTLPNVLASLLT